MQNNPGMTDPFEGSQAPLADLDGLVNTTRADVSAVTREIFAALDQAVADAQAEMVSHVGQTISDTDEHIKDALVTVSDSLNRADQSSQAAVFNLLLSLREAGLDLPDELFQQPGDHVGSVHLLGGSVSEGSSGAILSDSSSPSGAPSANGTGHDLSSAYPATSTNGTGGVGGAPPIHPFMTTASGFYEADSGSLTPIAETPTTIPPIPGIETNYPTPDDDGWYYHPPGETDWFAGPELPPGCEFTSDGGIRCRYTPIGGGGTGGPDGVISPPLPPVPPIPGVPGGGGPTTGGPFPPAPPPTPPSCPPPPPPIIIGPPNPPPSKPPVVSPPTKPPLEFEEDCPDDARPPVRSVCLSDQKNAERELQTKTEGSWCKRLNEIRPMAQAIGRKIMSGLTAPVNEWILSRDELAEFMGKFQHVQDLTYIGQLIGWWYRGIIRTALTELLNDWAKIADKLGVGWRSGYIEYAACRALFSSLMDSSIEASKGRAGDTTDVADYKSDYSGQAGLSVPGFLRGAVSVAHQKQTTDKWATLNIATANLRVRPFIIPILQCLDYLINEVELPDTFSVPQAVQAYLAGTINLDSYLCYCAMRGLPKREAKWLAWSNRARLTPGEVIALERRGLIDQAEMSLGLRELGFLDTADRNGLYALSEQMPPATDLIRFMVRDVADSDIVKTFELDKEFDKKWTGPLPKWGKAIGVSDELALNYWRAHWRLPGLHQVYECLHRLRPGAKGADGSDIHTTQKHVETLLAQDDVIPFWRQRLIAISYHPLTRVDAQRMRITGVIDDAELQGAFQDLGYEESNAKRLVGFTNRRRADFLVKQRVCVDYVSGGASKADVERQLKVFRVTPSEFDDLWAALDQRLRAATFKACTKAYRKRYLAGELDENEVMESMRKIVDAPSAILSALRGWKCEKASQEKQVPANQLCQWFAQNLITEGDFRVRLVRLGYSAVDAARIIATCKRTSVSRLKEATDRRDAKILESLEKAKKRAIRDQEVAAAKEARARRAADKEAAAEARRKTKLRKATQEFAAQTEMTVDDAAELVAQAVAHAIQVYDLTQAEAEAMVIDAVAAFQPGGAETLRDMVDLFARAELLFDKAPEEWTNPLPLN